MAQVLAVKSAPIQRAAAKAVDFPISGGLGSYSEYGSYGSRESALSSSGYIAAALRWKCEQFPQANFCVRRKIKDTQDRTKWDIIEDHAAMPLLLMPGGVGRGVQSRTELLTRLICSYELDGNAYLYPILNALGQPVRLRYLPHWAVVARRRPGSPNPIDFYTYNGNEIPVDRLIHWKQGVDPWNEAVGCSPLKTVLLEVLTESQLSAYTRSITQNMGSPARAMTAETPEQGAGWSPEWVLKMQDEYEYQSDNGLLVVDQPVKWQEFGSKPSDMSIPDISIIPKEKILSVMNVDPALVYLTVGYGDSKNTDKKTLMANGWKSSLLPLGTSLSERLSLDVLPDFGDVYNEKIDLDLTPVWALQTEMQLLHETNTKDYLSDILTKNEARQVIGRDPLEDGDKTHNQYPQLINGNAGASPDATLLNGTNGKLANEASQAHRKGTVEVN